MINKDNKSLKWVACYGNAMSVKDQTEALFTKDLTVRYPVFMVFEGEKIRLHLSNLRGRDDVKITAVNVALMRDSKVISKTITPVMLNGSTEIFIPKGKRIVTDEISISVKSGDTLAVSMYFKDYTCLDSAVYVQGPLSGGRYSYGRFETSEELPLDLTRKTNWYYFLETIDILTSSENEALICYGDSITAQDWPDYLMQKLYSADIKNLSVIRRAISGTRILRDYDCITYLAYGLSGEKRFDYETDVSGATKIIIQHGINDIIHPVGEEVNPWRPMSDLPDAKQLYEGIRRYKKIAERKGLDIYLGTLIPIGGWRTYEDFREVIKEEFNSLIRNDIDVKGMIDFDLAVRDANDSTRFKVEFNSGDFLHPSDEGYEKMAKCAFEVLVRDFK